MIGKGFSMRAKTSFPRRPALVLVGPLLLAACATAPLQRAIEKGDGPQVTALLDQGADRKKDALAPGLTPLKAAVSAHRPEIVKLLIARGVDVNQKTEASGDLTLSWLDTNHGTSALQLAVNGGDLEIVELLLAAGAVGTEADLLWVPGPHSAEIIKKVREASRRNAEAQAARAAVADAAAQAAAKAALTAYDSHSQTSAAPAPAAPILAAPSADLPRAPHDADFALIVGVEKYQDAPAARFAEADAAAVRDRLIKLGWPSRNVLTLTGPRAGRAGLERYLEAWLPANAKADSKFFFYFAGDGAVDPKTGIAYLLPWDADAGMLEQTGYPLPLLRQRLGALGPRGAAAVIDAGFSGTGERAAASPESAAAPAVSTAAAAGADRGDVLFASAPNETIGVIETSGRGLFTGTFLDALAAAPSGPLDLRALFDDVRARVSQQARLQGRRQTPRLLTGAPQDPGLLLR